MADEDLKAAFLSYFDRKDSPSRVVKKEACEELLEFLKTRPELPNGAVKTAVQLLTSTVNVYNDRASQKGVETVLSTIFAQYGAAAVKPLVAACTTSFATVKNCAKATTPHVSIFRWICLLLQTGLVEGGSAEWATLTNLQAQILVVAVHEPQTMLPHLLQAFESLLGKKALTAAYIATAQATQTTLEGIVLMALLAQSAAATKDPAFTEDAKTAFIDAFAKFVFGCKAALDKGLLSFSHPILSFLNHESFRERVLPVLLRSWKRQPEIMIDASAVVLSGLQLDLSRYAKEIIEGLLPHLLGTESLRASAQSAVVAVASHCSDSGSLEPAIALLLDTLNGKGVKLSSVEQRGAILAAVGAFPQAPLAGSGRASLAEKIIDALLGFVARESHEGTQAEAASQIGQYAIFLTAPSAALLAAVKATLEDAKAKHSVVVGYLRAAHALFREADKCPLSDTLLRFIEKLPSSGTHALVSSEIAIAAHILLRVAASDSALLSRMQSAKWWAAFIDAAPFGDKFAQSTGEDAARIFVELATGLADGSLGVTLTSTQLSKWTSVLVPFLVHSSWPIRKFALERVHRTVVGEGRAHIAVAALAALVGFLDALPAEAEGVTLPSKTILFAAVRTLVASESLVDARKIVVGAVLVAHHPVLERTLSPLPSLWASLNLDFAEEIKTQAAAIGELLTNALADAKSAATAKNSIKQLTAVDAAEPLRQVLVNWVCEKVGDRAVDSIGGYECAVWRSKEGVLYSESSSSRDDLDPNSKDYAERKWELEVRKELALKKGGKVEAAAAAPKLSKKQEEQQKAQLQKESGIRAEVTRVNQFLELATVALNSMIDGAPLALGPYLAQLVPKLLSRVRSALFSQRASSLFVRLSTATDIHPSSLASTVGATILRTRNPFYPLSADRLIESQDAMVTRVMRAIFSLSHAAPFHAPAFVYCLPLAEYVLRSTSLPVVVLEDALVFLNAHVDLGSSPLVPHVSVLTLLVHVIATHSRLSHQASILLGDYCNRMASLSSSKFAALGLNAVVVALLQALHSPSLDLRSAAIRSLSVLHLSTEPSVWAVATFWLARFDSDATNAEAASKLWEKTGYALEEGVVDELLEVLLSTHDDIRAIAAKALAAALEKMPHLVETTVTKLLERYHALLVEPKPLRDDLGNVLPIPPPDPWEGRAGISEALAACAQLLQPEQVSNVVFMFVEVALGDRNDKAQAAALKASITIVDVHGKDHVGILFPIIETRLSKLSSKDGRQDIVRQSAVVLLGTLAKHLDKNDPKIPNIVSTLLSTLWTPSQPVQEAVANCLAPLAPAIKDDAARLIASLMTNLLEGESYGTRRGAAYGIAGLVKGLSILALKQYGIMDSLLEAVQNKKNARNREGALMALELLCLFLGRLFEPYVTHVIPHLLICYGDGNADVRAAAQDTARAIMSKLSAHGVKLVLPSLLAGLDDDSWRTKAGSVELLGAMGNCAPKQLSACLPSIVPRLAAVLTDSHAKVQQAGLDALNQITQVIKNPEVMHIVPTILAALSDPANKTQACLEALLQTAFVHVIDAPSLAILMPVLQRALFDRASDTKMRAAQIIGNMYSLTDPKDLAPYIDAVIPGLQGALTDPTPEVRAVAAKALGATFKGLGESSAGNIIPWLLETLRSDTSTVDRAGAAQGLSEVLYAVGVDRLASLMDSFVTGTTHFSSSVREGHFLLFVYLPATFGELFSPFVARVIPSVLRGLADVEETVRDAATRTGQRIIAHFADQAVELLLPELEEGMQNEHWRIRESSIHLLGDLLYKISGVSGNKTTEGDEDDNFGTEEARDAILAALGVERRDRVYSRLYMARSDIQLSVRQAALHVWKVVVTHTVRTLREIMSTFIKLLLGCIASSEHHVRAPAARTLGELVKKLGERVLPDILPILEQGLSDDDVSRRQGVCIALVEIMESSSREVIGQFAPSLIPAVRRALCDASPAVREAAANTFSALHTCLGSQTVDDILPQLLAGLSASDASSEAALDGLRLIMASKSRVLLPFLVPRLIQRPISAISAKALAALTAVAGPSLAKYTTTILEALLDELQAEAGSSYNDVREAARVLVLSADEGSFLEVMTELLNSCSSPNGRRRVAAIQLLSALCQETSVEYSQYTTQLLRGLLKLFADTNTEVQSAAWAGVSAVLAKGPAEDKASTIRTMHQIIRHIATDRNWAPLPGFALPRGLEPFIALYVEGLNLGGIEIKELSAEGLGYLVRLTTEEELAAYSLKITGPLIRLSSEGVWQVRAATLATLVLLLQKIPQKLKAFIPQLQPTCVKALKESSRVVRDRATEVLTHIIQLQKDRRIDPLLTELNTAVKTAEPSVKTAIYQTLEAALHHAGTTATDPIKEKVRETLMADAENKSEEDVRIASARALAAWANLLPNDALVSFIKDKISSPAANPTKNWCIEHGKVCFMEAFAWNYGVRLVQLTPALVTGDIARWMKYEHSVIVACGASVATGVLHWACREGSVDVVNAVGPLLAGLLGSSEITHDALIAVLTSITRLGKETPTMLPRLYAILIPALFGIIRLKSGPVKKATDRALVYLLQLRKGTAGLEAAVAAMGSESTDLVNYHRKVLSSRASTASDDESES